MASTKDGSPRTRRRARAALTVTKFATRTTTSAAPSRRARRPRPPAGTSRVTGSAASMTMKGRAAVIRRGSLNR